VSQHPRMWFLFAAAVLTASASTVLVPATAFGQTAGITQLDGLSGIFNSTAYAISADGSTVIGDASVPNSLAFRWTQATGMVPLGVLVNVSHSFARGVSNDGSVVVGWADLGGPRAFRWTAVQGIVSLGVLNGGHASFASGVNGDGSVAVGAAIDGATIGMRAFRWTQATGMVSLGVLSGGTRSSATGVSGDGSVVVGSSDATGNVSRAFRWTQQTGMVNLGILNGGNFSDAMAVSRDGNVVVGIADGGPGGFDGGGFRWTQANGMVSLGTLSGGFTSQPLAVNADGSVIVGSGLDRGPDGNGVMERALRWTQATGWQTMEDWLRANGVSVPTVLTRVARGVSGDGNVVVGDLYNGFGFIARISGFGNGLISLDDLQSSLSGNAATAPQAASLGTLVLHGIHSRPLLHRVKRGETCLWAAGDLGAEQRDHHDGFAVGELGACYRVSEGLQASISLGRASSRQNLAFDGRSSVNATHGTAALLYSIPGTNLWMSGEFLYQGGDAHVRRGYLNGGAQDHSSGRADFNTVAARLRVDWEDVSRLGDLGLTPYADVSHSSTRLDAYTESGGAFPAHLNARKQRNTDIRVGSDFAYPLSSDNKVLGRLEAAHRFQGAGTSISGTLLGLFDFDLPTQTTKRDWLRASVGVQSKLGGGTFTLMLNSSTQGAAPIHWVNASYQVAF